MRPTTASSTWRAGPRPWTITLTAADGQVSQVTLPGDQAPVGAAGQWVAAGTPLSAGPLDPRAVVTTRGLAAAQAGLLASIQAVYQGQGVTIDDRHIEVVLRQMSRTVRVVTAGDTDLEPNARVAASLLAEANERVLAQGGVPAIGGALLVGVSEVARTGPSFLAAAAFQATARVLAEAALAGRVDELSGPLERVLLGQRIPAGTGFGAAMEEPPPHATSALARSTAGTSSQLRHGHGSHRIDRTHAGGTS